MGWQRTSEYGWRALVESDISRWKRVVGDGLRFQTDGRQASEVAIAADVLNRMLELGRPEYVRIAYPGTRVGLSAPAPPIHATRRQIRAMPEASPGAEPTGDGAWLAYHNPC